AILRATPRRSGSTAPPVGPSLPVALTFAATASRPTAVLTGPTAIAGPPPGVTQLPRPADVGDMTRVSIAGHPLTATAALIWNGDLPRQLQQILFDTADGLTPAHAPRLATTPCPAPPAPPRPIPWGFPTHTPALARSPGALPIRPACLHPPHTSRGDMPGQPGTVTAGPFDLGQTHRAEPGKPAQQ